MNNLKNRLTASVISFLVIGGSCLPTAFAGRIESKEIQKSTNQPSKKPMLNTKFPHVFLPPQVTARRLLPPVRVQYHEFLSSIHEQLPNVPYAQNDSEREEEVLETSRASSSGDNLLSAFTLSDKESYTVETVSSEHLSSKDTSASSRSPLSAFKVVDKNFGTFEVEKSEKPPRSPRIQRKEEAHRPIRIPSQSQEVAIQKVNLLDYLPEWLDRYDKHDNLIRNGVSDKICEKALESRQNYNQYISKVELNLIGKWLSGYNEIDVNYMNRMRVFPLNDLVGQKGIFGYAPRPRGLINDYIVSIVKHIINSRYNPDLKNIVKGAYNSSLRDITKLELSELNINEEIKKYVVENYLGENLVGNKFFQYSKLFCPGIISYISVLSGDIPVFIKDIMYDVKRHFEDENRVISSEELLKLIDALQVVLFKTLIYRLFQGNIIMDHPGIR